MSTAHRGNGRLKVLWVSDSPLIGTGFARVTREITKRLAQIPGIEIACLGWHYDGWPYAREQFPAVIFPSQGPSEGPGNFERAVNEFKPDVVITLAEIYMVDWLRHHPTRPRFKWIAYFPVDGSPFYPPWEPILKDVDELVTMSQYGRDVLQTGVASKRIHLIYHGVDTGLFRPLPERAQLKSHPRFKGKFVIGCVARNQARKNIPALVKAFALASQKIDDLHLYLHMNPCDVGYDIVTLLHRYGLKGKADVSSPDFSLQQPLEDEQLNRLYNIFDLTVLPTAGEGFGLPILESFAAGIPVVATDCSSCSELLRGRGELVKVLTTMTVGTNLLEQAVIDVDDLAACIEKLYRNQQLAKEFSAAALEFARSFSWDKLIPQWFEVIRLAMGAKFSGN